MTALVVRDLGRWPVLVRTVGTYVGLTGVLLLPSLVWVQVYEGIPSYIRNSLASVAVERSRTELRLPSLDLAAPFTGDSLLLVTYYVFWAVPVVAACALIGRMVVSTTSATERTDRALVAGLLVMGVLVNMSFLRANLAARFGDAIVPLVLLAACTVGGASVWKSVIARRLTIDAVVRPGRSDAGRRILVLGHRARARYQRIVGLVGEDDAPVRDRKSGSQKPTARYMARDGCVSGDEGRRLHRTVHGAR